MTTRLRVILVALVMVAGVMLWPATANAATFSGRVSGTGGQGLFVRPGPSRGSGAPMYTLAEGAGVSFDCYVRGEVIAGYWYTGNIWHHLTSGGWVSDTYIYTGYNGPVPGEPVCGSAPAPQPPPAPVPNSFYNRRSAVNWALANAQASHTQLAATCTWFVSNALWAGGFGKNSTWTSDGTWSWRRLPGTPTAWNAPMLISYIRGHYATTSVAMNFRNNRVPAAEVGDFVAYDWDGNGSTDHVAFIVNIAAGQYPEVSEWGVGSGSRTAYQKRGWTYSKVHGTWLQATYPSVKATLIHINGGHY